MECTANPWWTRYGIPHSTLNRWVVRGYLHPRVEIAGSGHYRDWSPDEVRAALALNAWRRQTDTLPFQNAAKAVAEIGRLSEPGEIVELPTSTPHVTRYLKVPTP